MNTRPTALEAEALSHTDIVTLTYPLLPMIFTISWLVGWLCLTSHRQRGHLETAPPFTVPCEGREAR